MQLPPLQLGGEGVKILEKFLWRGGVRNFFLVGYILLGGGNFVGRRGGHVILK